MKEVQKNPLNTREDMQRLAEHMALCAVKKFSMKHAWEDAGGIGTMYEHHTAWLEGFLRPLFGLVPLSAGGKNSELWSEYLEGIRQGTDPKSDKYWGPVHGKDQKMVEMTVLGLALALVPELVWEPLNEQERENLQQWLSGVNDVVHCATNNWLFFPVLVNVGLKKAGAAYRQDIIEEALEGIEKCYLGDGWYTDGPTMQRDYYIAFAMHFYGLIYSKLMEHDDAERSKRYRERAALFAKEFIHWFSVEGDALPIGRSLTYRFAMAAFWGALAYAGVEVLPWGIVKGILMRNIRWWIKQPIWDENEVLTVGYRYPNLKMAEFYNGSGSPAWAMKAFLVLALPKEHPFWQAEEEKLPELNPISVQKHPMMIVMRGEHGRHIQALTSGQYARFEPSFMAAKYEKFVYSNVFGFSVPGGDYGYEQGAYDSMLALCEQGDELYRVRRKCETVTVEENGIHSVWKPWQDVTIDTWLIPCGSWHVRVHRIVSERELNGGEAAYAVNCDGYEEDECRTSDSAIQRNQAFDDDKGLCSNANFEEAEASQARVWGIYGCTSIVNLEGKREGHIVFTHPNTNLLYSRTKLPTLMGQISKGETWLACAVLGTKTEAESRREWKQCPSYQRNGIVFSVQYCGKEVKFQVV